MQTTTNLGLKKPEDTDPIEIQDLSDNADIIDREMAKKAEKTGDGSDMTAKFSQAPTLANLVSGEKLSTSLGKMMKVAADLISHLANKNNPHGTTKAQVGLGNVDNTSDANKPVSTAQQAALNTKVTATGGDIANTKVGSITASTASYPVPAANDTVKVGFGKIAKFFGDIRNWMTGVCLIGQIVNNCVTNNAGLPLSAAQGKALMDLYTQLYSDYSANIHAQAEWNANTLSSITPLLKQWNNSGYTETAASLEDMYKAIGGYNGHVLLAPNTPMNPTKSVYTMVSIHRYQNVCICVASSTAGTYVASMTHTTWSGWVRQ